MPCYNETYHLATNWINDKEIALFARCGLVGTVKHSFHEGTFKTNLAWSLKEAQKHRDTLIKMGADPLKIRVEY